MDQSSSIEAAIYRFEYALKRLVELEHQLITGLGPMSNSTVGFQPNEMQAACRQLKYQTYLGLSRCELKRRVGDFCNRIKPERIIKKKLID